MEGVLKGAPFSGTILVCFFYTKRVPEGVLFGHLLGCFFGAFFGPLFWRLLGPRRSDEVEIRSWEKGPGGGRGRYKFLPLDCCIGYSGQFWCLSLLLYGFEKRVLDA